MVFIIAEAGVNHNGSLDLAKKLIDSAVTAGCDAVKFQTFITENVMTKHVKKADYQINNTGKLEESQYDMVKKLELSFDHFKELKSYCGKRIKFLSTPFDLESISFLATLGLDTFKLPSGEIDNFPYLRKIAQLNKKIILSTGMSTLSDIEKALEVLTTWGTNIKNITVLHCNTEYPTPMDDVNLKAMLTIGKAFNVNIGYSDHTLGIEVPIAAATMGAQVIEKHFTLDKTMEGPDHKASLEPDELKAMVIAIRNIELALGDGVKRLSKSEAKNKPIARKSIVAKKDIKQGELFSEKNITIKRPGTGISPMMWDFMIGQIAQKNYKEDDFI